MKQRPNARTKEVLVNLLKWATGQDKTGNPYSKEEVMDALEHLCELDGVCALYWDSVLDKYRD